MTIKIKQNLLTVDKPKLINCPKCKESLYWSDSELDVCFFCFKQLPSTIHMVTQICSRINYYEMEQPWY